MLIPHPPNFSLPDPKKNYDNVEALVSGWGRLTENSRKLPEILQKVRVRTISNKQCQDKWRSHRNNTTVIKDHMICTENPNKGHCNGDSGGPLVVEGRNGTYSLIGIVSFSVGCARFPDAYTRVSSLVGWIEKNKRRSCEYSFRETLFLTLKSS